LNEDLAETIALAHDLGHTPFGHAGENAIDALMKDHGHFDHNDQALTVIDELEQKYPDYNGLNLTWEVRTGLIKHRSIKHQVQLDGIKLPPSPHLESQVADLADDLTYYGHDVDDGLDSGLINEEMLQTNEIWQLACKKAKLRRAQTTTGNEKSKAYTVRCLIDMMVENAILSSDCNIEKAQLQSPHDAQNISKRLISFDPHWTEMTLELRQFLFLNVYHHPDVSKPNDNAVKRIQELFKFFIDTPSRMPKSTQARIQQVGLHRATSDYIASMTDRFALLEWEKNCT